MNIKVVGLAAIVAIVGGVYGILHQPQVKKAEVKSVQQKTLKIYLSSRTILKGKPITHSDIKIENWPESKAQQFGIEKDMQLNFASHPLAREDIKSDAIIYSENIISEQDTDYVDFVISPGMVPFPIDINSDSVVGGVIRANSLIDVLALASTNQNLANDRSVNSYKGVTLSPVLMNIKVIKVAVEQIKNKDGKLDHEQNSLILELTPKQVATLTIAKRIAQLEVHQSVKNATAKELSANAGDVLDSYHAITEFRAGSASVK